MNLFRRLESHRARLGLSVEELSSRAKIARGSYYRLREPGHAQVDAVSRLAFVLGVDMAELFRDDDTAPPPEAVALARCRDLIRWDGTDRPARFVAAVEMEWRARCQSPDETPPPETPP